MASAIKLSGDFQVLENWAKQLAKSPKVLEVVAHNLAEETVDLIKEGFERETDPYGRKWAPLVLREGRILADSGRMKNSWKPSGINRHGFRVTSSVAYAVYHQGGTGVHGPSRQRITPKRAKALNLGKYGMRSSVAGAPARKMVPDSGRLPDLWRRHLNASALDVLEAHFAR